MDSVLITGAGGFIGSALALAISTQQPKTLLLLDSSEQNLFQLRALLPQTTQAHFILGSINDARLLHYLFHQFHPQQILHAAAHKHVELLESNPFAAAQTNILGTHVLLQQAVRHCYRNFLLISTDKAANPHSIMGVTKRIAELLTISQGMNAIRLCNVFGSTGSVVPIFQNQIAHHQPLTVTHPDASRYFISLGDAVAAILSVSHSPGSGNIFIPEVGAPTRITDLAESLTDETDLAIQYIGLRAGEKLTEDLRGPNDSVTLSPSTIEALIHKLEAAIASRQLSALLDAITSTVPEYQPSELILKSACSLTAS